MTVNMVHCLFEQSGTFKREFQKLGVLAKDYDIQNEFGETDIQTDLFTQIENAYAGNASIFNEISTEDLIFAFFPCIYFCGNNEMFFCGTNYNYREKTRPEVIDLIIERSRLRNDYYILLLKLFKICEVRQLKMILENPYNAHHYLRFNFPYKPALIDMNRRMTGDYFRKPTQYFFVNCAPAGMRSLQFDKPEKYINNQRSSAKAGICSAERSMISPDYAHNFICDHILGIESGHSQPLLFNYN